MKKKLIKTIIKVFGIGIGCLIITIAGIMVYKTTRDPHKVPDILGYKPMIVLSEYKEASLFKGDFVIVKKTNNLNKNNIIVFRNEEDIVTINRISEITEIAGRKYFKLKEPKIYILEDTIEGIYLFKIPVLGSILIFLEKPSGLILLLLVILLIGLIWLYLSNKKEIYTFDTDEEKEFEEFKKNKPITKKKN